MSVCVTWIYIGRRRRLRECVMYICREEKESKSVCNIPCVAHTNVETWYILYAYYIQEKESECVCNIDI